MAKKPIVAAAPKMDSADAIELDALKGKMIGVIVTERKSVTTKFNKGSQTTDMNYVTVVTPDMKNPEKDPIRGVLFQKYFGHLPENRWFVGIVTKNEKGHWGLNTDGLDSKKVEPLVKFIESIPESDVAPF